MKKYIFGAVFSLVLLASPAFTQAAALTSSQISAIVSLLQSFGADQATINNVEVSLNGGTPTTGGGTQPWCHTFNTDLTFGSSGDDVSALSQVLSASGIVTSAKTTFFDENTAADVVQFQAKYGIRQTGYVGPITRAKLNSLYGCGPTFPPIPFNASPTSGSAPLAVTFSLNYSVAGPYTINYGDGASGLLEQQSCTSTSCSFVTVHTYVTPGTYKAIVSASGAGNTAVTITVNGTAQPSITVLSPNGGEVWNQSTTQTVRWSSGGLVGNEKYVAKLISFNGSICEFASGPADAGFLTLAPGGAGCANDTTSATIWRGGGTFRIQLVVTDTNGFTVVSATSNAFSITAATPSITLTSISPSSGPVGTSIRLDGCGSDSTSGFTLVYSGPKSGSAAIPVETLGAASGCGYMTINVPSDFPAGAYTLSVKNNQTGAMSTNSEAFTVTQTQPSITVLSPSSSTTVIQGWLTTIVWQSTGNANANYVVGESLGSKSSIGTFSASQAHCDAADKCFISWIPSITSSNIKVSIYDSVSGRYGTSEAFAIVAPTTPTPLTLTSISPTSGPVGTSIRLDGCGSDSTSGFTLVYSGPKSGSAAIPVETLGAASGCGYMTINVPSDFPAGTYSLQVKNNQTGVMSTNSMAFTVTSNYYLATLSVFPTSFAAGAPATITVANAAPNATIKVFCRDPNNAVCDDSVSYTTNASGQFTHTYDTTGWTVGTYRGWVTGNVANPFWSWRSTDVGFTVTAPAQTIVISRTPGTSLASPFKVGDATVSSSINSPSLFASNLIGTGYNQIGTNAPRTFTFSTFDLVSSGACNATTGVCNIPGNWAADALACPAGMGAGTIQYMTEWYTIGNVTSNKLNWYFKCSGSVLGANTFSYVWNRDLQIGSPYSDDVSALQQALTREGVYAGEITGGFYNQTYTAVRAFQEKYGINQTGYVGSLTRTQLNTLFAR